MLALLIASPFILGGLLFQMLSGVVARVMPAMPVVFVAAPGAGAERADDLTLRDAEGRAVPGGPDSVFALASRWDPIPWWAVTSTFGPDPVGEEFGGSAARLDEWIGHSDYFEPGSVPMVEIGRALGR